jgi:protein-disulfide isomerase
VVGGDQAAEAAECADEQGAFWEYHDALYVDARLFNVVDDYVGLAERLDLDDERFRTCLETGAYRDEIANDYNDGRAYGVTGTPTFFINGVRLVGAQPLAAFQAIIDEELRR